MGLRSSKRCSADTYRMTGDLRVCGLFEPLGLEWTQCVVLSRSRCGGLRSSPEPVVGGSGATRTRRGSSRRSWRVATRCAPWLDGMDCRRSSCLVGPPLARSSRRSFRSGQSTVCASGGGGRGIGAGCSPERKVVRQADSGIIEIEVGGITIRAGRGADPTMIASIVQALRASR